MLNKLINGNFLSFDIRKLYDKTIWYNNTYTENISQDKMNELKELAKNRKIIAERYQLKQNISTVPSNVYKMFEITSFDKYFMYYDKYIRDHIEYYKTSKMNIYSYSPIIITLILKKLY